jgi:hypothetical protein
MNSAQVNIVPTAVVLAVGGYVVWPHVGSGILSEEAPAAKESKGPTDPQVPQAMLKPELVPPPVRDPFDDPEEGRARARAAIRDRLNGLVKGLETLRRVRPGRSGGAGNRGKGTPDDDPLAGLTLNATYIQDGRSAAVINGRLYRPGQPVEAGGGPGALVLKEVRLHSVVVRDSGRDLELTYGARRAGGPDGDAESPPGAGTPAKAAPRPAAKPPRAGARPPAAKPRR